MSTLEKMMNETQAQRWDEDQKGLETVHIDPVSATSKLTTTQVMLAMMRIQGQIENLQKNFQQLPGVTVARSTDDLLSGMEGICDSIKGACVKLRMGNK